MTGSEFILWNKINEFQLDDPAVELKFSERLARENGWSLDYTRDVIQEYKKFIFLCCISETGITPSEPVDQAWHLHLTFTKSYWVRLCKNTLEKEIHHNPTKGGRQEAEKFNDYYTHTHKLYLDKFGAPPPINIWQPNEIRFSDIDFQRVNLRKYWLLKKPGRFLKYQLLTLCFILTGLISIQATSKYLPLIFFAIIVIGIIILFRKYYQKDKKNRSRDKNGCDASGCTVESGHHAGSSGCASGCSGCSASGCSGCGGSD